VIVPCGGGDAEAIFEVVNDAAVAYRGVIPAGAWHEPYMPLEAIRREMAAGVRFSGFEQDGVLLGVMGLQHVRDVTLIRHAYVRTERQGEGIGGALMSELRSEVDGPLLVGTWADATWAIAFYERHGFALLPPDETARLLDEYWDVPDSQASASVVLQG
jgi:GNAT superfamily N-acetyltransferase